VTPQDIISKYDGDVMPEGGWIFRSVKTAKEAIKELERYFPGKFFRQGDLVFET